SVDAPADVEQVAEAVAEELEAEDGRGEREPGEDRQMRRDEQEWSSLLDHRAPRWQRRWRPEAEERKARLGDDRARHAEGRLDDERRCGEGKQVTCEDPEGAAAEPLRGLDELAPAKRRDLGAREARVPRPAERTQRDDDVPHARPEDRRERDREEQSRKREEDVDQPRQRLVDPAAAVARERAEEGADDERDHDGRGADRERYASAVEDPRRDVAPEAVLAEPVSGRRGTQPLRELGRARIDGHERAGADAGERQKDEASRARDGGAPSSRHRAASDRSRAGAGPSAC